MWLPELSVAEEHYSQYSNNSSHWVGMRQGAGIE